MRARRGGALVNVSSAAGIAGFPWHVAYSASKFGLRGISEVLRFDLKRYGIDVCLVVPQKTTCYATYSGDLAPVFMALGASFRLVSQDGERSVPAREFFVGDGLTGADIQLLFVLEAAGARLAPYPALVAYRDRMHARPAYRRGIERGGPYQLMSR